MPKPISLAFATTVLLLILLRTRHISSATSEVSISGEWGGADATLAFKFLALFMHIDGVMDY